MGGTNGNTVVRSRKTTEHCAMSGSVCRWNSVSGLVPRVSQDSKKRIYVRGQGLETYLMEKEPTIMGTACQSRRVKLPNVMSLGFKAATGLMTDHRADRIWRSGRPKVVGRRTNVRDRQEQTESGLPHACLLPYLLETDGNGASSRTDKPPVLPGVAP